MTQLIFLKFIISRSEHMLCLSNLPDDKKNNLMFINKLFNQSKTLV